MTLKPLVVSLVLMLAACGAPQSIGPGNPLSPFDAGRADFDAGHVDAGLDSGVTVDTVFLPPGPGALRGNLGCHATAPVCDPATEYLVTVGCLFSQDGTMYAAGGIAGAWCYPKPSSCSDHPTCSCLEAHGGFEDAGVLRCPGNYFFCIDGAGAKNLHCNPP
jgi:hypothetical protein